LAEPLYPIWREAARVIGRCVLIAALATVIAASPYFGIPAWTPALATRVAFEATSLIGLNLIFGVTGMLALGQAAFAALPGYVSGILQKFGMTGFLSVPVGIVVTLLAARAVAGVFIRLPGVYFAIGTLGLAYMLEGIARAFPSISGGASGLVLISPVSLTDTGWYILAICCTASALAAYAWLVRGSLLRTLKLVRHDELAAEVLGIDVIRIKSNIFTIGCTFSAVGGILLAYFTGVLVPENGGVNLSLESLAMVIIGGAGTIFGPLVGASAVQWLFAVSGSAERYELLVYGVGFFFVVLFSPAGIAGLFKPLIKPASYRFADVFAGKAEFPAAVDLKKSGVGREADLPKTAYLEVRGVTKRFGGLVAVDAMDIDVRRGEIVALIGPNGAGKSTLFNLINGIEHATGGSILLGGRDLQHMSIHERALLIGRSFQVPRLVPDMTVLQNIAARIDHLPARRSEAERLALARHQLARFSLSDWSDCLVRDVGLGYHKLIDLARASLGEPPLRLLDEPAVGLTEAEVEHLCKMLVFLKERGAAILVVEHNIAFVTKIADRVVAMESGKLIAVGAAGEVIADPAVQGAYFGALQ
jgi:ABC-type branched-subunit amino acid transport system ATPase component/ABC-type branched-subunit amino acid transport system permease subunit